MSEIEFIENSIEYASDHERSHPAVASKQLLPSTSAMSSIFDSLNEDASPNESNCTHQNTFMDDFSQNDQKNQILVKVWPQYHHARQPDLGLSPSTEAFQEELPTRLSSDGIGEFPSLEKWSEVEEP